MRIFFDVYPNLCTKYYSVHNASCSFLETDHVGFTTTAPPMSSRLGRILYFDDYLCQRCHPVAHTMSLNIYIYICPMFFFLQYYKRAGRENLSGTTTYSIFLFLLRTHFLIYTLFFFYRIDTFSGVRKYYTGVDFIHY